MENETKPRNKTSNPLKLIAYMSIACLIVLPFIYIIHIFGLSTQKGIQVVQRVELNYLIIIGISLVLAFLMIKIVHVGTEKKKIILLFLKTSLVIYALYLFLYTTGRYLSFASNAIDVPYFHYALVQLSHFQIPRIWDIPQRYVWADHFSPILILLVPLYWIIPGGTTLMMAESLLVLIGAIPLYKSAKYALNSQLLALSLTTAYLTFGGLQMAYDYGFHEIVLLPPIFFGMYYFYQHKQYVWYFVFVFLSLCVKEEVTFIMIAWGLYSLIMHKNKMHSLLTLTFGIVWYVITFHVLFPYFTHGTGFGYWGQYHGSPGLLGIASYSLTHFVQFLATLVTPSYKIDTIFHTFTPFVFLPLLFPPSILILLPSLLEKLMSDGLAGHNGFHYSVAIAVVTVIASIETLKYMLKSKFWKRVIPSPTIFLGIAIMYCAILSSVAYGYYPLSPFMAAAENRDSLSDIELQTLNNAIASIPKNASVSAHAILIAHFNKPMGMLTHGPRPNDHADYIITDSKLPDYFLNGENPEQVLTKLISEGKYKIVINENSVVLLQKVKH